MKHAFRLICMVGLMLSILACAGKGSTDNASQNAVSSLPTAGPANYHTVYSNIEDTIVTLRNFRLRTADGKVIVVPTDAVEVDLQDLMGLTKGLKINLSGITFPGGAATADIVEIETDVVGSARTVSADNSACELTTPKLLNFYTSAAVTMIAGETYLVKVNFSPLNSIQIDVVPKQNRDCDSHSGSKQNTAKQHSDGDLHDDDSTDSCNAEVAIQKCELVNRRQPVSQIIRPIDEF